MSQSPFQKFVPKKKNSLIKEEFKQAKKKAKKERAAAIDRRFEEKRQLKAAARNAAPQPAAGIKTDSATSPAKKANNDILKKQEKIKSIEKNFEQVKKIEGI